MPKQVVPYYVILCPCCDSTDHKVTSTQKPIRWHKCNKCGENFQSYETYVRAHDIAAILKSALQKL